MKTLYFDCFAGASGNMILGGLLSIGLDQDKLVEQLKGLAITDFELFTSKVDRAGLSALHVEVRVPDETKHRHLHHIEKIINESALSASVKDRSKLIFQRLAEAEARVHGTSIEKVHFHEVGAMDAIVDVVGACIGFEMLGIDRFIASKLNTGTGFVKMAHGTYPVPPPAVVNLLVGAPVYSNGIEGELLTPTGAAIISTICETYGPMPEMIVEQAGYGAGTRTYDDFPNVIRLILGHTEIAFQAASSRPSETIIEKLSVIESNIDDISPEVVGYLIERALDLGALDCWSNPVQMKKSRPGFLVSVLCRPENESSLRDLLFRETGTLGIRSTIVERHSLPRSIESISTKFGNIDVKISVLADREINISPEYDHVRKAALEHNVTLREVYDEARLCFRERGKSAAGGQ